MRRKTLITALASLAALTATACNTVRGVGQDIQSAADAVDAAI